MTCRCGYYSTCYLACSARMIELIQAAHRKDAERWAQEQREHALDKREEREGEPFQ